MQKPVKESTLLKLPAEIRSQIFRYLMTCAAGVVIRSLFIREYYRTFFMSQQHVDVCTPLLLVCRQITNEILPILYAGPMFKCFSRVERLCCQVGLVNFGFITQMNIDIDDVYLLDESLSARSDIGGDSDNSFNERLNFHSLEVLEVEAFHSMALRHDGNLGQKREALRLCYQAQRILKRHPWLRVVVQRGPQGNGGSDAIDLGFGRLRWRLLKDDRIKHPDEQIVDLELMVAHLETMLQAADQNAEATSLAVSWTKTGIFRQYPYLDPLT